MTVQQSDGLEMFFILSIPALMHLHCLRHFDGRGRAVAEVLDTHPGLPVTPDAKDAPEGRQCSPHDALGRPHHPLESPAVAGGAVTVPGDDTARTE